MIERAGKTEEREYSPLRKAVNEALKNKFRYVIDKQSPPAKTVSLRRGELYIYFYPEPDSGPSEFTVIISKPGLVIEWASLKSNAKQLRKINDVLGFDLIGKPAGQEVGNGTTRVRPLSLRTRVLRRLGI